MTTRTYRVVSWAAILGSLLAFGCGGAGASATGPSRSGGGAAPGQDRVRLEPRAGWRAVVDVSVATLWSKPAALRPMDAPSAANPVDIPSWLSRMTVADRRWLVGRVQTQAVYGTAVSVLRQRGRWSYVVVAAQPTQLDARGYPGWMPTRQLTGNLSLIGLLKARPVAVVTARTAWLRDPATLKRRIQISYATRLPIVGRAGDSDVVATPDGGRLAIRTTKLAEYPSLGAIQPSGGRALVRAARSFLGLPYLWGGVSGYGFDCSGLTYAVHRRFGIRIPRDADQQAVHGTPVRRANLRPGDLVFFAGPGGAGFVHHVAMYAGSGRIVEAPNTGSVVRVVPLSAYGSTYAGARRYLPATTGSPSATPGGTRGEQTSETVQARILARLQPDEIVLMHTLVALPRYIAARG
jgi:cell wall-associated NlpC family hydrolase